MRVLQVSNTDLVGKRFNGFDLIEPMRRLGIECQMAVLDKRSTVQAVTALSDSALDLPMFSAVDSLERRYGMNGILYPWGDLLGKSEAFLSADLVHYHLIHNKMISILDLPRLFAAKPTVWTFHDSWPLTAHCVQPCGCTGWTKGCEDCPSPSLPFPLPSSTSAQMWRVKDSVYAQLDIDIVVGTEDMRERVRSSPLGSHFDRIHHIPFSSGGLDVQSRDVCRKSLGLREDTFAILFRATPVEYKGLRYLTEALRMAPPSRHTTLLAVEQFGLLSDLASEYEIREYGWADDALYSTLLGACDAVITPYPWAIGFGLMAAEAMAAARTVVCFENTSLATVTHAPDVGVAAPRCDSEGLRRAIDRLMSNREECSARGRAGQEIAHREYTEQIHVERMAELYRGVVARRAE